MQAIDTLESGRAADPVEWDSAGAGFAPRLPQVDLVAGTCPHCLEKLKSNSFLDNHIRLKHPGKELV